MTSLLEIDAEELGTVLVRDGFIEEALELIASLLENDGFEFAAYRADKVVVLTKQCTIWPESKHLIMVRADGGYQTTTDIGSPSTAEPRVLH